MILIDLKEHSEIPIYRQIMDQLVGLIDRGHLAFGSRLPSTRVMAENLAVNRSTVYKAYQELWALGYIESRPGSYSTVRMRGEVVTPANRKKTGCIDWQKAATPESEELLSLMDNHEPVPVSDDILNFVTVSPDPRLMPTEEYRKCLNRVLARKGEKLLQYGDPMGYKPLREYVAEKMRRHSMSVSADEILLTNGSQNAIELVLKLLVAKGTSVAVESPTYSLAIPLFRSFGAEIREVPVIKGGRPDGRGMDLDLLGDMMAEERPALVYAMPNFQNPTGVTTGQAHRERLLGICERYRVPLLEDGFVEEMKYFGRTVLPVKSMDRNDLVIYLGSFSKVLFPGLRIGWAAANRECVRRLCAVKKAGEISGSILNQAALNLFCRSGLYDLHIKRVHRIYRKRMQAALAAAEKHIPKGRFRFTKPSGGYMFWVTARDGGLTEEEITGSLSRFKVAVSPGRLHFPGEPEEASFRISIAHRNESEIKEGMCRIGEALRSLD